MWQRVGLLSALLPLAASSCSRCPGRSTLGFATFCEVHRSLQKAVELIHHCCGLLLLLHLYVPHHQNNTASHTQSLLPELVCHGASREPLGGTTAGFYILTTFSQASKQRSSSQSQEHLRRGLIEHVTHLHLAQLERNPVAPFSI